MYVQVSMSMSATRKTSITTSNREGECWEGKTRFKGHKRRKTKIGETRMMALGREKSTEKKKEAKRHSGRDRRR